MQFKKLLHSHLIKIDSFLKNQQFWDFSFPNHSLDESWLLKLSENQQNQKLCLPTNQNQITYNHREIAHNCYRSCGLEILTRQLPYSIDFLRMRTKMCMQNASALQITITNGDGDL